VLADEPSAFADACIQLAEDAKARQRAARRAFDFVGTYDWDVLVPALSDRFITK
jgi:hypothetical protein